MKSPDWFDVAHKPIGSGNVLFPVTVEKIVKFVIYKVEPCLEC